jgi:hypothetical protein
MHDVFYTGGAAPDMNLGLSYRGQHGYGKQAGIAIVDWSREGRGVLRLHPITSRRTMSGSAHLEVPEEAVPALIGALEAALSTRKTDPE